MPALFTDTVPPIKHGSYHGFDANLIAYVYRYR